MIATAAGVATISLGAGMASASGGGVGVAEPPAISDVLCAQKCAGAREASVGSRVRLEGRSLASVQEVAFAGDGGRIGVAPASVADAAVEATVPAGAVTGTVTVDAYGAKAESPADRPLTIVPESAIPTGADFKLTSAQAPRKTYYDGVRKPKVTYLFAGAEPTDVRIEVVDRKTREVLRTWVDAGAAPNSENTARWDGRTSDGKVADNGEYRFRIGDAAGTEVETTADSRFGFYKYRFPIAGRHGYGDGFGAGRGHQGQDVFAKCGTALRAARGGHVEHNKTHAAAGNYLVIDGKRTGKDFMYAHMARRSPLQPGARVRTGQRIGEVGDTGNASGCHLHFEVWSPPGWYEGGQPLPSVTAMLKIWDRWS
jgi:murein DD-endopeptidase MepM/ murein hydrolase activator NlpD